MGGNTVDGAILAEAHGLVAEMLNDPHLPPAVMSGLQALYLLLAPSGGRNSPVPKSPRNTPCVNLAHHDGYASGSDSEESPYTGERPSVHRVSAIILYFSHYLYTKNGFVLYKWKLIIYLNVIAIKMVCIYCTIHSF